MSQKTNFKHAEHLDLFVSAHKEFNNARNHLMRKNKNPWPPNSPCELCGDIYRSVWHHDDYGKPFDVRCLCQFHHMEWHNSLPKISPMFEFGYKFK
jgi:hypothetical protein